MARGLELRTGSIAVDMPRIQSTSKTAMVWRRVRIWPASPVRIRTLRARSARSTTSRGATAARIACISAAEIQRRGTTTAPASAPTPRTGCRVPAPAATICAMRPRRLRARPRLDRAPSNSASRAARLTGPPVWRVIGPPASASRV